jgi:hypothetical protein
VLVSFRFLRVTGSLCLPDRQVADPVARLFDQHHRWPLERRRRIGQDRLEPGDYVRPASIVKPEEDDGDRLVPGECGDLTEVEVEG